MSTDLIPFTFENAEIRTVLIDGEPWWVASDVCSVLGYSRVADALRMLDEDDLGTHSVRGPDGLERPTQIISEAGLYSLILRSKRPEAKAFKRWVTHEVIPQIRKTGSYSAVSRFEIPKTHAAALRMAAEQLERAELAEARVAELEPDAAAGRALADAKGTLEIGAVANMFEVGRTTLFRYLYAEQILQRNRRPYQEYITKGWFRVVATTRKVTNDQGELIREVVDYTSYLYPAGALEMHKLLTRRGYTLTKPKLQAVPDLFNQGPETAA